MDRVFLDSTVLFAASYSARGHARDLVMAGLRHDLVLALSPFVLIETERNLTRKGPHALPFFEEVRIALSPYLITPSEALTLRAAELIHPKDAPIVAGAVAAGARFLATFDRRDLLNHAALIESHFGVRVATPGDILAALGVVP